MRKLLMLSVGIVLGSAMVAQATIVATNGPQFSAGGESATVSYNRIANPGGVTGVDEIDFYLTSLTVATKVAGTGNTLVGNFDITVSGGTGTPVILADDVDPLYTTPGTTLGTYMHFGSDTGMVLGSPVASLPAGFAASTYYSGNGGVVDGFSSLSDTWYSNPAALVPGSGAANILAKVYVNSGANVTLGVLGGTEGIASSDGTIMTGMCTTASTIPEPGTLALLAMGLMGLVAYAWRKRK